VLSVLAFGGRRLGDAVRRAGRGPVLQRALGVIMIATALAMVTDADLRFQSVLADHLPSWLVTPTEGLEKSNTIQDRLADLRGNKKSKFAEPDTTDAAAAHPTGKDGLPDLGVAPDFTGNQEWFNTADGKPLHMKDLRGKVVLVDFWTYTCINCLRTLPYVKAWDAKYRAKGLVIVGVHTPEFSFEKDAGNVESAIKREGLRYPVAQDNDYKTWDAYGNQYWPAKYLIDATGHVRDTHFGEGAYEETEKNIRTLLAEAGSAHLGSMAHATTQKPTDTATPETYLGGKRADRFAPELQPGTHTYPTPREVLPLSNFALAGTWNVDDERSLSVAGGSLYATIIAKRVFLVAASTDGKPHKVHVVLNGREQRRAITITDHKLYELVSLKAATTERMVLHFDDGIEGYAFTFG
jgi:thiol-disulfide isomerase/thioredoxin